MVSTGRPNRSEPRTPRQRRGATAQPTKAQIKAMQARSMTDQAGSAPSSKLDNRQSVDQGMQQPRTTEPAVDETPAPGVLPRRGRRRVSFRVTPLPRPVEYAFIRSDMRRLLVIAGVLLVLMLVPLVAIGL